MQSLSAESIVACNEDHPVRWNRK